MIRRASANEQTCRPYGWKRKGSGEIAVGVAMLLLLIFIAAELRQGEASPAEDRGFRRLTGEDRAARDFDPSESLGLFIGVGQFDVDAQLTDIDYAVDDAIDLAHLFALELQVVDPGRVHLLLSGEPEKNDSRIRLKALQDKGATRHPAIRSAILNLLPEKTQAETTSKDGLLILSFATHGFSHQGEHYLMAGDSLLKNVDETSLKTGEVLARLHKSPFRRQILLLDACRAQLVKVRRATPDPRSAISRDFIEAITQAEGQVILSAAREGGYAYGDSGNGVFTAAILDGLRCEADTDGRGFVTPVTLVDFVSKRVTDWMKQHPGFSGPRPGIESILGGPAARMPLNECRRKDGGNDVVLSAEIEIRLVIRLAPSRRTANAELDVHETKDDHPVLIAAHSRRYSRTLQASPGFRIVSAKFQPFSAHEFHDSAVQVSPDGSSATLTFRLKSGPAVDRYRGWIHGKLIAEQEQVLPGRSEEYPLTLSTRRYGDYFLRAAPEGSLDTVESVAVTDIPGLILAQGRADATMVSRDGRFELTLTEQEGAWVLKFFPHFE